MLRELETLPADLARVASGRLAAGAEGRALGELVETYGSGALRAEAAHPGIGGTLVRELGADGIEVATKLNDGQARSLAVVARDLAALPAAERATVWTAIRRTPDRFFAWLGGMIAANPGTFVLTAVTVAKWDALVGSPSRPGLVAQAAQSLGQPVVAAVDKAASGVAVVIVVSCAAAAALLLWRVRRRLGPSARSGQVTPTTRSAPQTLPLPDGETSRE